MDDFRFRSCLKMADTGSANLVGKLFFNIVQTKCFVLKPQKTCKEKTWWGKCKLKKYRTLLDSLFIRIYSGILKSTYGREALISVIFIDGKPPKSQLCKKCIHCIQERFQLNRLSKFCIIKTNTYRLSFITE